MSNSLQVSGLQGLGPKFDHLVFFPIYLLPLSVYGIGIHTNHPIHVCNDVVSFLTKLKKPKKKKNTQLLYQSFPLAANKL